MSGTAVTAAWVVLLAEVAVVPAAPVWSVTEVLLVISAVTVSITTIINALDSRKTRRAVEVVATDNKTQVKEILEVKKLVDGPVSSQLRQIADLLEDKAVGSGNAADIALAVDARQKSDDKDTQVAAAVDSGERDRRADDAKEKP